PDGRDCTTPLTRHKARFGLTHILRATDWSDSLLEKPGKASSGTRHKKISEDRRDRTDMADRIERAAVEAALAEVQDPEKGRGNLRMEQVRDLVLADGTLSLTLALTTHSAPLWKETQAELIQFLRHRFAQLSQITVNLAVHERPPEKLGEIGLTSK